MLETSASRESLRLIVLTDRALAAPRSVYDVVHTALAAGARAIQLRDKHATAAGLLDQARELRPLTRSFGALLFVDDRLDVALAAGADGVHLGPDDIPVAAARAVAPPGFLVGFSADRIEEAKRAEADGVDYIGCGTVFPTTTKTDAGAAIGVDGLDAVAGAVGIPVVGIGGINAQGSREIARQTRASGVAVVGAVMGAQDPGEAVRGLLAPWLSRSTQPR